MKFEKIIIQTILIALIYSSLIKCNLNVIKILNQIRKGELSKEEVMKFYNKDYDPMLELNKIFTPCLEHLIDQESQKTNENLLNKIASTVREFFSGTYEDLNLPDLGLKVKCDVYINNLISPDFLKKKKEEISSLSSNLISLAINKNESSLKKKYRKEADPVEASKDAKSISTSGSAQTSQKSSGSSSVIKKNLNIKTTLSSSSSSHSSHSYSISGKKDSNSNSQSDSNGSSNENNQITLTNSCEKNLEIFRKENEKLITDLKALSNVLNGKNAEIKAVNDEKCKCEDKVVEKEKKVKELQEETISLHELINKSKIVNTNNNLEELCAEKFKQIKEKEIEIKTCNENIVTIELKLKNTKNELDECKGKTTKTIDDHGVTINKYKTENENCQKDKENCDSKFFEYKKVSEKNRQELLLEIKELQKKLKENKFEKELATCNKQKTELNVNLVRMYDENNVNIEEMSRKTKTISLLTNEKNECLKKSEICKNNKIQLEKDKMKLEKEIKECHANYEVKLNEKSKTIKKLEHQITVLNKYETEYETFKNKEIPRLKLRISDLELQEKNVRKEAEDCLGRETQVKIEFDIIIKKLQTSIADLKKQIKDEKENISVLKMRAEECVKMNEKLLDEQSKKLEQVRLQSESNCKQKIEIQINLTNEATAQLEKDKRVCKEEIKKSEKNCLENKNIAKSEYNDLLGKYNQLLKDNKYCKEEKETLSINAKALKEQTIIMNTQIQNLQAAKSKCPECHEDSLKIKVSELEKEIRILKEEKRNCESDKKERETKYLEITKERDVLLKKIENSENECTIKLEREKKIWEKNCQQKITEEKSTGEKNKKLIQFDLDECKKEKKQLDLRIQQLLLVANFKTKYDECVIARDDLHINFKSVDIKLTEITNNLNLCINQKSSFQRDFEECKAKKLDCEKSVKEKETVYEQCEKKNQEINDSYLKTITKIKSETSKQITEITNINNYYTNTNTEITNITNEITIEIKNINIQIESARTRKSEKDSEKEKLKKTIEDQRKLITELTKQKENLRNELKRSDKSDIVQIDRIYTEIENIEVNIQNTYIIIDKNILIFEQNCGDVSQLSKEIEILQKNVEYYSSQEARLKETFKEMQTYILSLEKLVKETEIINNQYNSEFTVIIQTNTHSETVNDLVQGNLKKCESDFKVYQEAKSAFISRLEVEIKSLKLSITNQKSECIAEKEAIKKKFDAKCQININEIELKYKEIQIHLETSIKKCQNEMTISGTTTNTINSITNISSHNNKIDLEMCIALISEPKYVNNNCKNLETLRKRYNQNCMLDPLPAPNKEIQTFATYDLKDNNQHKLLRRLNF